ncbi:MAG: 50S ribosomal protein L21e [archaeon]|jgi:large subunit ribosomal protein L21e
MPRKAGKRGRTRCKLKARGTKATVNDLVKEFDEGDTVQVVIKANQHDGFPDKSFQGLTGKVVKRRGSAFEVKLDKGNQSQIVVTTAVHLKQLKQQSKAGEEGAA